MSPVQMQEVKIQTAFLIEWAEYKMKCSHFSTNLEQFSFTLFSFIHCILLASHQLCKSLNSSSKEFCQLQNLEQMWVKPINTNSHFLSAHIIACQLISLNLFFLEGLHQSLICQLDPSDPIVTALLNDMAQQILVLFWVPGPVPKVRDSVMNKTVQIPALIEFTLYKGKTDKEARN